MPGLVKRITSWSFTRFSLYQQCPLKLKLSAIDKIKEPPNDAMVRGAAIGELAEKFLRGKLKKLPKELMKFASDFKTGQAMAKKRTMTTIIEDNWAFTKDWLQTKWDDWANCWVRIKLDWAYIQGDTLFITDWKTGKFRPEDNEKYLQQLDLYALAGLLLYPHVDKVNVRLAYLDHGITYPPKDGDPIIYHQRDVPKLKKAWEKRTKAMLNDTLFPARPNRYCYSCHFRASNKDGGGGQCKF